MLPFSIELRAGLPVAEYATRLVKKAIVGTGGAEKAQVQAMLKVGLVEAAASVIAGIFKRTPLTFAAAGAVQAVTMAYLVRIAGKALAEYYRNGESWGEEGIEAAILRQFELNSRSEFLQEFAGQAVDRVLRKIHLKVAKTAGRSGP